jgi:hypothetical protein
MILSRLRTGLAFLATAIFFVPAQVCWAQNTPSNQNWSSSNQQENPNGTANPTRTTESHSVVDGHIIDKITVETLGPDGRYVPYSITEKESVRVNNTTVRNVERSFGRGPDGERTLIQEKQEESRSLPGGDQKTVRTTSSPDANGALQVVRRETEDSKQLSPNVRQTNTTIFTPDVNGGLAPTVQIEQRDTKGSDGSVQYTKSTSLADGTGRWQLSEVREGVTKPEGGQLASKDERVLRPDSNGHLAVVERKVTTETKSGAGEQRDSVQTYSTNVPGQAGDDSLQLVQRETTVQRKTTNGVRTTRQIEQPNPGDPTAGLHVTEEAIDIVRPGSSGAAHENRTILTPDANGQMGQVWVDVGKTDNPSAVQVDTRSSAKPQ